MWKLTVLLVRSQLEAPAGRYPPVPSAPPALSNVIGLASTA
jgi:hypothetical protein